MMTEQAAANLRERLQQKNQQLIFLSPSRDTRHKIQLIISSTQNFTTPGVVPCRSRKIGSFCGVLHWMRTELYRQWK